MRHVRDLLVIIGQFDLSHTPLSLNQALGTLYRQLRDCKFVEDNAGTSEVTKLEQDSTLVLKDSECQTDGREDAVFVTELPQAPVNHVTTEVVHVKTSSECSETESFIEVFNSTAQPNCLSTPRLECAESDLSTINDDDLYYTANDLGMTSEANTHGPPSGHRLYQNNSNSAVQKDDLIIKQTISQTQSQARIPSVLISSPDHPSKQKNLAAYSSSPVHQSLSLGLNEVVNMGDGSRDSRPEAEAHFTSGECPTLVSTALQGVVRMPSQSDTSRDEEDLGDLESSLSLSID